MTLRYALRALAALALLLSPAAGAQDLVLTGVFDGPLTGGVPKAVELYAAADIADLSQYGVGSANNGGGTDGAEFVLSGSASEGDFLYVTTGTAEFQAYFGFPADFDGGSATNVNGDDAIELFYDAAGDPATNGVVIDVFGDRDTDGSGQPWEYLDGWVYRTDGTGPDGATFAPGNWIYSGVNATDGETTNDSAASRFPVGTYTPTGGPGLRTFNALLRGANETTPNESDAQGGATAVLDGVTLTVSGTFSGLTAGFVGGHVHAGSAAENGPVVFGLTAVLTGDMTGGSFLAADNVFTVRPTFADSIRSGLAYVNVHSSAFPGGEIRDQLTTQAHALPFGLTGDQEVPPVETMASGFGQVVLTGSTMIVTGNAGDLESDFQASHVHAGARGMNGPPVVTLDPILRLDLRAVTWEAEMNTFDIRPTFADSLRAGLGYVNVHTASNPGGEIRGQIGTFVPGAEVAIAEARAAGVGALVTVTGTVSRAMGAFTYIQDDTGGLTLRQTSGAFFDAVADGTIAAGTQVRVTGTLSEFNALLQINGGDLADFEIVGNGGPPPAPQTVTLAELAANGEAYEGELVTVDALTFLEGVGTEFAPGTNYAVSDDSDASGAVSLRVPNAADTDADGSAVPAQANVTGIAGQFSSSDPAAGYQLLLLRASDVDEIVSNENTETAGLSLAVANPLRGAVPVRFATGTPGPVRLVLHDALGRRVATLADGETDGGARTAVLDASALATGVYVLRLDADGATVTRTLTVVR